MTYVADLERDTNRSWFDWAVFVAAILFALWHIATNLFWFERGIWQNAIHYAGFAFFAAITITFVAGKQSKKMYLFNIAFWGVDWGFCSVDRCR